MLKKIGPQTRAAEYRADSVDEEARTAEFVISTEAPDTYDTVFLSDGWDLKRYEKNPVVSYNHKDHDANPDLVIGTSEVFVDDQKRLIGKVTFEAAEDNPLAEKIFRKVKNGILRGASIWADIRQGRWGVEKDGENPEMVYFTEMELRAWSIVTVQSNPDALARNAENLEELKKEITTDNTRSPSGAEGTESEGNTENRGLGLFDAQLIINQNSQ